MYEEYNVIGHGVIKAKLYGKSEELYEVLKKTQFIQKLFEVRQLGSLRHFLKGAHYTKYEYMLIQNTLLNEFKNNKKKSGLGTKYKSKYLSENNIEMSRLEVLHCLSLLTNAAHFPDTYTASKHWLQKLEYNEKNLRTIYRNALSKEQKKVLGEIIKNRRYHDIHIMNMIFLIKTSRINNVIFKFCQELLLDYLTKKNTELNKVLPYYETARKISYLTLDSHYAPIPIKIDYQQVMNMFGKNYDEDLILNKNSTFQKSLNEISELLQNTVYLSPETLLHKKEVFLMLDRNFQQSISENIKSTKLIKDLLNTQIKDPKSLKVYDEEDKSFSKNWHDNYIDLDYKLTNRKNNSLLDLNQIEKDFMKKIGNQTGLFNIEFTPNYREVKIVCAFYQQYSNKIQKAFELVNEFYNLNQKLNDSGYELNDVDKNLYIEHLLRFILKFCFDKKLKLQVDFESEKIKGDVFFIDNGKSNIIEEIINIKKENKENLTSDEMNELKSTLSKLKEMDYKGLYIVYIGSTILRDKEEKRAEFDGIICTPNNKNNNIMWLIEAKNTKESKSKAVQQLDKRLTEYLNEKLAFEVESFNKRDAFAEIKFDKV